MEVAAYRRFSDFKAAGGRVVYRGRRGMGGGLVRFVWLRLVWFVNAKPKRSCILP